MINEGISKENAVHVVQVSQLVMELQHTLWIDSEHALQEEKQNSLKLKTALQVLCFPFYSKLLLHYLLMVIKESKCSVERETGDCRTRLQ